MATLINTAAFGSGVFLILEGGWSIFLKQQAQEGYAKPATIGRAARMGIGAAIIYFALEGGVGDAA